MKLWSRLITFLLAATAAFIFAVQNGREFVTVRFPGLTLRSVSLPVVVFGAALVGMLLVFLVGMRADLRTRRLVQRYRDTANHDN